MEDRDIRALFEDAEWAALRLSVALVCRDATGQPRDAEGWARLASTLGRVGLHASRVPDEPTLSLRLLADFTDEVSCLGVVANAQALVAELPEPALRAMTEFAAALVDRVAPDQAFHFRATLILVSMLAGSAPVGHDRVRWP